MTPLKKTITNKTLKPLLLLFSLTFVCCLYFLQLAYGQAILPAHIVVDETKALRKRPQLLFGFNHNWIHSGRLAFNQHEEKLNPNFIHTLRGLPMPLNRMSGTVSQSFQWKKAIGPFQEREKQLLAKYDRSSIRFFGPLEWIKSSRKIDPRAQFSWVFNMRNESPQDHADLVEFLAGSAKANINGGTNWAKKRIDFGMTRPVEGCIWELGNELDHPSDQLETWDVEKYIRSCKEIIQAVRKIDPTAKFAAHAATAPWSKRFLFQDWRNWHRRVLQELGPNIDYISFHPYYLGKPISEIEEYLDTLKKDIPRITGNDRIHLYLSEHAVWPPKPLIPGIPWSTNWYKTHSLAGCLGTAHFLNRILMRPEVALAAYHSLNAGPWGLIYRSNKNHRMYTTGIFDLFKIYNTLSECTVVGLQLSGTKTDPTSPKHKLSAVAATKKDGGLRLIIVNNDAVYKRKISLQFRHTYRLTQQTMMSAQSIDSRNTEDQKEILINQRMSESKKPFNNCTIDPKTITSFILERLYN